MSWTHEQAQDEYNRLTKEYEDKLYSYYDVIEAIKKLKEEEDKRYENLIKPLLPYLK